MEGLHQGSWAHPDLVEGGQPRVVVGREPLEEVLPEAAGEEPLLRRRQLAEARIEPRLEGTLAQQPRAEGVDGAHEGTINRAERDLEPFRRGRVQRRTLGIEPIVGERRFQPFLEALAELAGGLAREGDGRQLPARRRSPRDQPQHTVDQGGRLAGSCACLHEQVVVQGRLHESPLFLVRRHHDSLSRTARSSASAGSLASMRSRLHCTRGV